MELKLTGVTKKYGRLTALKDFSYVFREGVYGLLGPNGAGKSTLMNLIVGNLKPDEGDIFFDGEKIDSLGVSYLKQIGYAPQQQNLYPNFTGKHFLYYMASLKGVDQKTADREIPEILEKMHLKEKQNRKIKEYSGGMKQRLLIGQALLGNPSILILDEPTAGLDPKERIGIRNIIMDYGTKKMILFATHVVPDIEKAAGEVLFLKNGEMPPAEEQIQAWKDKSISLEDVYLHIFGETEE